MARLCLLLLLPLLPFLASRLAVVRGRPVPCDSAGDAWRGVAGLPADILRQVLELVPRLPVVAWRAPDRAWRFVRPGAQQSDRVLGEERRIDVDIVRFWPRGDRVLTWPAYGAPWNVTVWDVLTGCPLQTLQHSTLARGDGGGIRDAQVCPAGDRLATRGTDGIVVVWDVFAVEALKHLGANAAFFPRSIHWLGATQLAITGGSSEGGSVDIWDFVSDSTRHVLRARRGTIRRLEISPCGSKLLTVDEYARVYHFCLWDIATGSMQWTRELESDPNDWDVGLPVVDEVIVSLGGARVLVKASWYDIRLLRWMNRTQVGSLDGSTGEPRSRLWLGSRVHLVGLLAGGRHIAAINSEEAAVWDTETGERLFSLERDARLPGQLVRGRLAVSPCGRVVAFCGQQVDVHIGNRSSDLVESLAVWDGRSGRMLFRRERRAQLSWGDDYVPRCAVQVAAMTAMADEFLD